MTRNRSITVGPEMSGDDIYVLDVTSGFPDPASVNYGPSIKSLETRVMQDELTANFAGKMQRGEISNNPMLMTVTTQDCGSSSFWTETKEISPGIVHRGGQSSGGSTFRRIHLIPTFPVGGELFDPADGIDIAKLHALAHIDPTPYSFAEDLAELSSTVKYLKGKAWKFEKASKGWRKAYRKLKAKAKSFSNLTAQQKEVWLATAAAALWLEYRFVVMPLARSITDAMEAYNTKVPKPALRQTARGKYETKVNDSGSKSNVVGAWDYPSKWKRETSADIRAGILYEITNPSEGFRFKYGLRNKDIPVTLWNVVRLSFMVDRYINISASLKALTNLADPNIKILAGWTTNRITTKEEFTYTAMNNPSVIWKATLSGSPCKDSTFVYSRSVWSPTVSDALPTQQLSRLVKDVTSVMDLIALGVTAFSKK